jgi:hypothetical protein
MKWTKETARNYIQKVNKGKITFGLKYLSACDYLGIKIPVAKLIKKWSD